MRNSTLSDQLIEILETFPEVDLAVLFGSLARGTMSGESDIDLALRLKADTPDVRRRLGGALGRALGRDLDLVPLDASPPQLRFEIARDGIPLVERREHAWADFQSRAMIDWWDWAPIARRIHAAAVDRLREKAARGSS
jgi:predicted nucleotidyltransferase